MTNEIGSSLSYAAMAGYRFVGTILLCLQMVQIIRKCNKVYYSQLRGLLCNVIPNTN